MFTSYENIVQLSDCFGKLIEIINISPYVDFLFSGMSHFRVSLEAESQSEFSLGYIHLLKFQKSVFYVLVNTL